MNRSSFFKSLLTLAVAPKIIGEIDFNKKSNKLGCKNYEKKFRQFKQLNEHGRRYYEDIVRKYGNENYHNFMMTLHDKI
jgi:hypothetical protein